MHDTTSPCPFRMHSLSQPTGDPSIHRGRTKSHPIPQRIQDGFTLLEVLVVLALLGFLLAMTAPRMSKVPAKGLKTTTSTNMIQLVGLLTSELQQSGRYPTGMINIVSVSGDTGTYHKPMISDQDPDNGPEVLSPKMDQRHRLFLHALNEEEARELRKLGVLHVYNYNSPYDRNVTPHASNMQPVTTGVAVLMTGGGADTSISGITVNTAEEDRAHPNELFRMAFGLGAENSLVVKGLIHGPPTCAESGLKPTNYEWKWYSLLLPRLEATAKRLANSDPLGAGRSGSVTTYAVTGSRTADELNGVAQRTVDTYTAQNPVFFAVLDSEGAIFPTVDMDGWGIDFNKDGKIE